MSNEKITGGKWVIVWGFFLGGGREWRGTARFIAFEDLVRDGLLEK